MRVGDWDLTNKDEPHPYVQEFVVRRALHPYFNRVNLHNDVAILTLENPIDLAKTPHINPACMPQPGISYAGRRSVGLPLRGNTLSETMDCEMEPIYLR